MTTDPMRLLVAVISDREKLDEVLSGFLELGITGATVVDSEGMGRLLSDEVPIFAGLQTLIGGVRPRNRLILSVIPAGKVAGAIDVLEEVCGSFDNPSTGIAFTLPVDTVVGLAPELGTGGTPL